METWTDLCRCCLSAKSEVSLLDSEQNIHQQFLEITTIKVNADDGLPQKLCRECYTTLKSAYHFRKQCIKMDTELKAQLINLLSQCNDNNISNYADKVEGQNNEEFANDPMKQLEAVIKQEPMDSDDDYYYVLVIDNPQDKENTDKNNAVIRDDAPEIKSELINNTGEDSNLPEDYNTNHEKYQGESHNEFNSAMDFLMTNNIPVNVPATILENEEEGHNDHINKIMKIEQMSHESDIVADDSQHDMNDDHMVEDITDNQKIIKILTTTTKDGTIVLKTDDQIEYLTDGQLVANGNQNGQEVILCEGDESQFQILEYDESELVIEYADDGQIASVLQQDDDSFLCGCGEQFDDLEEYEKHQSKHNPAGEHLCNLCGKGFETAEILTGHRLLHKATDLLLKCPFCDTVMKRSMLTQHIKYSHNNVKPQCEVCHKTFANPNNLKRHMMIHRGIKEFECDICFKRFHQKITMQNHRVTHVNPLICPDCGAVFSSKTGLDEHKETGNCQSKDKEELLQSVKQTITTTLGKLLGYSCSICSKMFTIESALEKHVETSHMVNKSGFLCSDCGEVLSSKKEMQEHLILHGKRKGCKRFECSICGKGCSSQAMLIMHERVHTNERPFACQLCPLKFKTKTHLRTHQLTHTREKKFGCSACLKFFALKGNLVVHLRTHTGERPYVCSICGDAFIDSKYLKKHKLKKHAIDNVPWNQYIPLENEQEVIT